MPLPSGFTVDTNPPTPTPTKQPPLPPGFSAESSPSLPPLPDGFTLEAGSTPPKTSRPALPPGFMLEGGPTPRKPRTPSTPNGTESLVRSTATRYGVDPDLALSIARRESGLNQGARSDAGAIGVMQLEPGTARDLGVDPTNLEQNVRGGVRYFKQMLDKYGGDTRKALAAYNAGPGAVDNALFASAGRKLTIGDRTTQGDDWLTRLPQETQRYVAALAPSLTGDAWTPPTSIGAPHETRGASSSATPRTTTPAADPSKTYRDANGNTVTWGSIRKQLDAQAADPNVDPFTAAQWLKSQGLPPQDWGYAGGTPTRPTSDASGARSSTPRGLVQQAESTVANLPGIAQVGQFARGIPRGLGQAKTAIANAPGFKQIGNRVPIKARTMQEASMYSNAGFDIGDDGTVYYRGTKQPVEQSALDYLSTAFIPAGVAPGSRVVQRGLGAAQRALTSRPGDLEVGQAIRRGIGQVTGVLPEGPIPVGQVAAQAPRAGAQVAGVLANQAERAGPGGTPTLTATPWAQRIASESGQVRVPNVSAITGPIHQAIQEGATTSRAAHHVADELYLLGQSDIADKSVVRRFLQDPRISSLTQAQTTALTHYAEDRSFPIDPKLASLYDNTIRPMLDDITRIRNKVKVRRPGR